MAEVKFERVHKVFSSGAAVEDLNLDVPDGDFLIMVGPSGCGKTTSLRMLAGLERPTYGRIFIGPKMVNKVPAKDRDIAMVFQSYALYPHKSVRGNLAWGMKVRKEPRDRIKQQVDEVAEMLGITKLLDKRPANLSGGERQRVALGRALLRHPQVFLMDEPLSNLDAALRVQMRSELIRLHATLGTTMVYVTHDQTEAMTMGTRIVVMAGGRLQQVAPPEQLYDEPANLFVATFIGSPKMNIVPGRLVGQGGVTSLEFLRTQAPLDMTGRGLSTEPTGRDVLVGIRPEDLHWIPDPEEAMTVPAVDGRVEVIEPMGPESLVTLRCAEQTLIARFPPRCSLEPGDRARLSVDLRHVQIFDPESEQAILVSDASDRAAMLREPPPVLDA
jgi:multiple sugar transport system ATP-binding protein